MTYNNFCVYFRPRVVCLLEVDGVTEGVSECLSIKTGLLYLTKLKLVPTTFDSSSTPVADERSPALSAEPFVVVVILWVMGN